MYIYYYNYYTTNEEEGFGEPMVPRLVPVPNGFANGKAGHV